MCPNTKNILADFEGKLRLQRYAPSSIKTYKNALAKFLVAFASVDLEQLTLEQITQFLVSLQKREKISVAYQKQIVATIAKFYQLYYNKHLDLTVLYPHKKANPLPRYLTIPEVKRLLNQCNNIKHLCILNILYGCGLRV